MKTFFLKNTVCDCNLFFLLHYEFLDKTMPFIQKWCRTVPQFHLKFTRDNKMYTPNVT